MKKYFFKIIQWRCDAADENKCFKKVTFWFSDKSLLEFSANFSLPFYYSISTKFLNIWKFYLIILRRLFKIENHWTFKSSIILKHF